MRVFPGPRRLSDALHRRGDDGGVYALLSHRLRGGLDVDAQIGDDGAWLPRYQSRFIGSGPGLGVVRGLRLGRLYLVQS